MHASSSPICALKIVLDSLGTLSYISPVPSAGGRSREAVRVGRERRLRPGLREPRARGPQGRFGSHGESRGRPSEIRPPRTTAGARLPGVGGGGGGGAAVPFGGGGARPGGGG